MGNHVTVLDGPGVWMEGDALDQLERVAATPSCVAAAGMPDLHPGPNSPIGATVALKNTLWPALLGGDLGCGVRVMTVSKVKAKGDDLERRMQREMEDRFPLAEADPEELMAAVWARGPAGLVGLPGVPEGLQGFAAAIPERTDPVGPVPDADFASQLGTVGGGNHFLELSRVVQVTDRDAADSIGCRKNRFAVVAHSGSRALGKHLASKWGAGQLAEADAAPWLADLAGAVNFARTNRLVLCWRMLRVIGASRTSRVLGSIDVDHNTAERSDHATGPVWLHRKGSAPAYADQLTVVLGSRGSASWIMKGTGSEGCLCSVAHGAGRKFDRSRSIALIKHRYKRSEMVRTSLGGRVMCDDRDALYAEHPDCYKAIEPVVAALEAHGAATRVAALHPMLTVKR
jgi:release factor H-coupled RctB family protein